jgi:predicted  nucleic acid-binding Zn-ribbon protein
MTSPVEDWLAKLAAAQPAEVLLRLTNLEAQQTTSTVALAALAQKITTMEAAMASAADYVARVDNATNEIASDLQTLRDQLQAVRDEIPAAQQAAVDAALTQLDGPISRLEALGQEDDAPVDGGDVPAEPTA